MRYKSVIMFLLLSLLLPSYVRSESQGGGTVRLFDNGVLLLEDDRYLESILNQIKQSQSSILISMYLFKTTGSKTSAANKVKDALIKAAKRGVKVKVLLEVEDGRASALNEENRITAGKLKKGGVQVFFDSPRRRTHVKAIVIDERYTFIGSHNLTASALQYNRELSLMIDSEEVAKETAGYIEDMITNTRR